MTAIELTFPAGRFHATPWGRHVNEGAVEWPPSPWRLLRALVATWKRKAPNLTDEGRMQQLLTALSSPPEFSLPPATFGHTRHYMPWFKKGPGDKTLVFDSFVAVAKEAPLIVLWPDLDLSADDRVTLTELLPLLGTFGRAESWCNARLLTPSEGASIRSNCRPVNGQPPEGEVVRVLGVDPQQAFANDHNPKHETTSGRGKNKVTVATPHYDPDWHLCMETLRLHEQRWSMPPGSLWLEYDRPRNALASPPPRRTKATNRPAMQVVRFALDSAVLPLVTDTIRFAENARQALMSKYGYQNREGDIKGRSRIFSGKETDSTPIQGHLHCYYLPTDEDGDGRLDHLTLLAAEGFSPEELRAIDSLREIHPRKRDESNHPLRVILLAVGRIDELHPGPLQTSQNWISATPYLATRHPKTRGKNAWRGTTPKFLGENLRMEIGRWFERQKIVTDPASISIEPCMDENGVFRQPDRNLRPIQFHRFRNKRNDDGGRRPAGFFRVTFPEPVAGPLALGHSSHFGLGLFVPVHNTDKP